MGYTRFLPLITPLVSFLLLEIFYSTHRLIYVIILIIISVYLFSLKKIIVENELIIPFFRTIVSVNVIFFFLLLVNPFGITSWVKEDYLFSYDFYYQVLIALNIFFICYLIIINPFVLQKNGKKVNLDWILHSLLPTFFTISMLMFITLVPISTIGSKLFIHILFMLNTFFLYNYFEGIYFYYNDFGLYKKNSIENFSSYGNFLTVYFFSSAIYGFQSFLSLPSWILMMFILLLIALLAFQVLYVNKIDKRVSLFYSAFISLLIIELAWSVSFLSLSYYILGIIVAINYYLLIGLTRFYLLGKIDQKIIKLYLSFSFGSLIFILLTSKWLMG